MGDYGKLTPLLEASAQTLMAQANLCMKSVQLADAIPESDKDVACAVIPLLWTTGELAGSVAHLCAMRKLAPSLALARSLFEATINVCYLLAEGTVAANEASAHFHQKTFRDLQREIRLGGLNLKLSWTGTAVPSAELEKALTKFTTTKGKERRSWTELSIEDRIRKVTATYGSKVGTRLAFGLLSTYRYGSEIIHATLFGAMYVFGLTEGPARVKSKEEHEQYLGDQVAFLTFMSVIFLGSLFQCLAARWSTFTVIAAEAKANEDALVPQFERILN